MPDLPVLGPSWCKILPKRERDVRWKAYQGWYCLHTNARLYVLLTRGVTDGSISVQAAESHAHSGWSQSIPPLWGKRQAGFGSVAASNPEEGFAQPNMGRCHAKPGKRDLKDTEADSRAWCCRPSPEKTVGEMAMVGSAPHQPAAPACWHGEGRGVLWGGGEDCSHMVVAGEGAACNALPAHHALPDPLTCLHPPQCCFCVGWGLSPTATAPALHSPTVRATSLL